VHELISGAQAVWSILLAEGEGWDGYKGGFACQISFVYCSKLGEGFERRGIMGKLLVKVRVEGVLPWISGLNTMRSHSSLVSLSLHVPRCIILNIPSRLN
jgi:hypothetical protein